MTEPRTVPEAFQHSVAARPDAVALRAAGDARTYTWRQYGDEVRRIAGGLAALGVKRGDTFAAMLTNRPEFNLTEAAASHLGATTYSIYNTSSPEQIRYVLEHAETAAVVTERQFEDRVRSSGAAIRHLLVIEDGDLDALQPAGDFDFEAAWTAVDPEDVLCLIYTSGTTGAPKGVEHTHRGALALAHSFVGAYPYSADDRGVSYLPSSHAADRYLTHYFAMVHGFEVTSVADTKQLTATLSTLRPTIFAAVPRIWEKVKIGVDMQLEANPELAAAFDGDNPDVIEGIRAALGLDQLKWALSGAAAIPPTVYSFLRKLRIPVSDTWGMSECGLATGVGPAESIVGTVGKALPGVELRIADDGELLLQAPFLMKGYRNDPAKTAEAVGDDGWLRTGDVATIDDDGYVRIIDRKKELIINAGGKNMSPTNIEAAISAGSSLIGPVVAIGDGRPYNVALVTLDPDAATAYAARLGFDADPAILAKDEQALQDIAASIEAGNQTLSRIEQIKRYTVLPMFWDAGGEEMTPTMKLKRKAIAAKYAAEIDELYARSQ